MLRDILGPLLAFAGGVGAMGALVIAVQDVRNDGLEAWALFCSRLGFATVVGIISYIIAESGFKLAVVNWRTWVYTVGLFLAAGGYATLITLRRRNNRPPRGGAT